MKAQPNQSTKNSFRISALVVGQNQYEHLIEFSRCENNNNETALPKYCCGGYCGSALWKKMLPNQQHYNCHLPHQYPTGTRLAFEINPLKILLIQSLIWLLPTLIFLLTLSLFTESLITLIAAFSLAIVTWYYLQRLIKNPFHFVKLSTGFSIKTSH